MDIEISFKKYYIMKPFVSRAIKATLVALCTFGIQRRAGLDAFLFERPTDPVPLADAPFGNLLGIFWASPPSQAIFEAASKVPRGFSVRLAVLGS